MLRDTYFAPACSYYFCGLSYSLIKYYVALILGLLVNYELERDWNELLVP